MNGAPQMCAAICAFNAAATIAAAIQSSCAQTLKDIEILVIDDGSSDETARIVAELAAQDGRIRLFRQPNRGISASRNRIFDLATAPVVAFLDADDQWLPHHLETLCDIMADPNVAVAFSNALLVDSNGQPTGEISRTPAGAVRSRDALFGNPCTTCSTMAIRRSAFLQTGPFREGLDHAEDQEWILRALLMNQEMVCSGTGSTVYRTSNNGQSADLARMHAGFRTVLATAERIAPQFAATHRREAEGRMMLYLARRAIRVGQGRMAAWRYLRKAMTALPQLVCNGPGPLAATLATFVWPSHARRLARLRSALSSSRRTQSHVS